MNKVPIDWLGAWFEENKTITDSLGVTVTLFVANTATDKPAQVYELESSKYLARVGLWNSGELDIDAIAKENPDGDRFYAYRIISSIEELDEFLQRFVSLM